MKDSANNLREEYQPDGHVIRNVSGAKLGGTKA